MKTAHHMKAERLNLVWLLAVISALGMATMSAAESNPPAQSTKSSTVSAGIKRPNTTRLNLAERRQQQLQDFLRRHSDPSGKARSDLWLKSIEETKLMPQATTSEVGARYLPSVPASSLTMHWVQIGPAPLWPDRSPFQGVGPASGEVTDIAIDPRGSTDQVIYIAANDGGIWKSTNGGASWAPKTDFMTSLSMGAVALDPANPSIVYAGTGNYFNNGFFKGVGLYRSTDGGDTWALPLGNSVLQGQAIKRIVLPTSGVLLVGTDSGLYKSVDSGAHYGNNSPLFSNGQPVRSGNISDLHLDTAVPSTVYVCVISSGLFRSTDSGTTFGASLFDSNIPASFGNLSFAQSKTPNNQTIYVNLESYIGSARRIFKSTNGGASWTEMLGGANAGCGQCNYDQTTGVDPLDANRVYIGFEELFESTNGGASFVGRSTNSSGWVIHADHHAMAFSPHATSAPSRVYVGTDGGISYIDGDGLTFSNINSGIGTCLFRGIDIGRSTSANRGYTYGGCQDTSVSEHRPSMAGTDWHEGGTGDGSSVVVDPANALRAYSTDGGYYVVTSDGGLNWEYKPASETGLPGDPFWSLGSPAGIAPSDYTVVYETYGGQLLQSTNTGTNFVSIHTFTASIWKFAVSQSDSNRAWVSLTDSTLQRTLNARAGASSTWTPVTVSGALNLAIGAIAVDPTNANEVIVVYEGYTQATNGFRSKHVFRSTNGGSSWSDISGTDGGDPSQNLPDIPLHSVVIDSNTSPHTIIVASDAAVFRSVNLGATWQVLGTGLPTVDCTSLALDSTATPPLLRVGTYGRSVFELKYGFNVICVQAPAGLIDWWRCEGDAVDSVGGVSGSLSNGVMTVAGMVGLGLHYDGTTNAAVQIPNPPSPQTLSIEAWVKFDSLDSSIPWPPGLQYLVFRRNSSTTSFEGFTLLKERVTGGDRLAFVMTSLSPFLNSDLQATNFVTTNVFYHVVGSFDGATMRLYVNGMLHASAPHARPVDYGPRPMFFGTSGEAYDGRLAGTLDEVCLYDRALTAQEVASLYASGSDGKCPQTSWPPVFHSITHSGGGMVFTWSSTVGHAYQVQYKTNLAQTNWVNLGAGITATNSTVSASDLIGPDPQRFYRVVLLP